MERHLPVSLPSPRSRPLPQGRDRGLGLLYWFLVATAIVVVVVLIAGAVAEMWILIPGMAIHLLMTFLVLNAIARLMARDDDG